MTASTKALSMTSGPAGSNAAFVGSVTYPESASNRSRVVIRYRSPR